MSRLRHAGLTGDFTRHDLRRTVATGLALGYGSVVGRILNHVQAGPRATAVYDRYDYDREKRTALDA